MTAPLPRQHLADVASFVKQDLAGVNRSCRDLPDQLSQWIRTVSALLSGIDVSADHLGPEQSLVLLNMLGFIAASGERHAQFAGHEPGWIVRQFDGLDRALVIAAQGRRSPALTAELYWQRNDGVDPLGFTNEAHELLYISAVRTQIELHATVNRQLRALSQGWRLDTAEGARMLRIATAAMRESRCQYMELRRGSGSGPALTPEDFDDLRSWRAPTVVCGQSLDGPDAAHLADVVATDILLGTVDEQ